MPQNEPLFSARRSLADYSTEWLDTQRTGPSAVFGPTADPLSSGTTARRNLGASPASLHIGHIADAIASTHCYRVLLEGGRPAIPCTALSQTSMRPVGTRAGGGLMPGSIVVVMLHAQQSFGLILGVIPPPMTAADRCLSDYLHLAGRCGIAVDKVHNAIFQARKKGGVTDYSAGRPRDSLTVGDWSMIAETGLKASIDSAMAQFGLDEFTGLTVFYRDMLTRLGGYNLQIRTHASEEDVLNDQGETHWYEGRSIYPWEALGAFKPGIDPFRELPAQQWKIDEPHYSKLEPSDDHQQPFHRIVEHKGYTGQGGKRQVIAPPEGGTVNTYTGVEADGPAALQHALFEEQTSLTGKHMIRSAKGIHLRKTGLIPSPMRRRRPEDATGDTEANYQFAGREGQGPAHVVTGQVATTDEAAPHMQQAAALWDVHAHCFNWEGIHGFHYHKADWETPDEGDLAFKPAPLPLLRLADQQYLPRPQQVEYTVDHRYGKVTFYINDSSIDLMDDGAVLIKDGYGSKISMIAGNIFADTPGDFTVRTGRNFNVLAGRDICLRSHNSIDLSATQNDVRIKAERNAQVLAGNGGEGAVLIESRGSSETPFDYLNKVGEDVVASGIHLKAASGPVVSWSNSVYLRTGGGTVEPGPIVLDAARGDEPVITHSSDFVRILTGQAMDSFGESAVNTFGASGARVSGTLAVGGTVTASGGGLFGGSVNVMAGHIFTEQADQYSGRAESVPPAARDQSRQEIADATNPDEAEEARDAVQTQLDDDYYAETKRGHDDVIDAAGFSFRTTAQYRTEGWTMWEADWQRLLRIQQAGGEPAVWEEAAVEAGSEKTYPYPGKEPWADEESLREQDSQLVTDEGVAKPRTAEQTQYETARLKDPTRRKPDGNYLLIS